MPRHSTHHSFDDIPLLVGPFMPLLVRIFPEFKPKVISRECLHYERYYRNQMGREDRTVYAQQTLNEVSYLGQGSPFQPRQETEEGALL